MDHNQIIKVLQRLGSTQFKTHATGVSTNCPLYWQHRKGSDNHPSMFIFATERGKRSVAYCHSCLFKGPLDKLIFECIGKVNAVDNQLLQYVQQIESGQMTLEDVFAAIPSYEDIPNYINRPCYPNQEKLQEAVRQHRKIEHSYVIPKGQKDEICVMEYGKARDLTTDEIDFMVRPYIGNIPPYWFERGFDNKLADEFLIGEQKDFLYHKIKLKKEYYIDFGPRLLIPVKDFEQKFVGWSARTLAPSELPLQASTHSDGLPYYLSIGSPKYMHCPSFKRNHYLYGEHLFDISNRRGILVEGFFDVIRLRQANFKNVFAIMGTGIGHLQMQKIKRFFDEVVLFFDGDDAGMKATQVAFKQLKEIVQVKAFNPHSYWGVDPCDCNDEQLAYLFRNLR